jgi:hypothetical protein
MASIAVASVVATVDKQSVGAVYHISFQLKETGGQSGATISSVLFTMPSGAATFTATYTPPTTQRVPAGASLDMGPIDISDKAGASTAIASEISVAVSFTDDGGRTGSATGTASIAPPALLITYTVSGLVTDGTSGPSGRMPGTLVKVLDGLNAGLSAVTDGTGNYAITGISPGGLTLSASATDYETATQQVTISGDTGVNFVLARKLGPVPAPPPGPPPPPAPPPPPSPPPAPAPINMVGTWTGTGVDSMGTVILTWALTQTGSALSGTVKMQAVDVAGSCNSCHRNKTGTFSGTINGTTLSTTMVFPKHGAGDPTPDCTATLTGTASNVTTNTLTAAYSGVDSCEPPANNGTVVMTR